MAEKYYKRCCVIKYDNRIRRRNANSVAVGNPCKVIRTINELDVEYYYKDRKITQEDLNEEANLR